MSSTANYSIYTDGGSRGNPGPGASAFVVYLDKKEVAKQSYFFQKTTNNVAEYFAVLMAVSWLEKNTLSDKNVSVNFYSDSELLVKQLNGAYKVKSDKLKPLNNKIKAILLSLNFKVLFNHVTRNFNSEADRLVNEKMDENL